VQVTTVASTPSHIPPVAASETLDQLEYTRALDLVAGHAVSELGADSVRQRLPMHSADDVREALAAVGEVMEVCQEDSAFTPRAVPDLRETLQLLHTPGSVLEAEALHHLGIALGAMRETGAALSGVAELAPRVAALAVELPPVRLEKAIERAIEPDGRIKDDASPGLKKARKRVRDTRTRLVGLLEKLQKGLSSHEVPADVSVTLRGGRYVIPMRADARSNLKGIVHGESSSGVTLFVEPAESVELGNELTAAESEEGREVLKVLRGLTDDAREFVYEVEAGWSMCIAADDLYARGKYALATDAVLPKIGEQGLVISKGFHPLILADAENPMPFDLQLEGSERTIVVSGPNAGGKTVLLKAVGLISAMTQAGIVPPVGKDTVLPVFSRVFCDIGDHQSIEASLSTFSGHVAALKSILVEMGEGSLVLLDELGGGTDPQEGAALAGAVVLSMHESGGVTIATTHLGELKELAARTDGIVNASLEFDGETLAPTYRFLKGKPGRSYALAIARRLGMPDDVLATADELTPEAAKSLEATLAELERREAELSRREEDAASLHAKLEADTIKANREREELEVRLTEQSKREVELERTGREQARKFLLEARKRVEEALGTARAAVNDATAKEARRLVEDGVREEGDALKKLREQAEKQGWKVKGQKDVQRPSSSSPLVSTRPHSSAAQRPSSSAAQRPDVATSSELDLRGLRVDEAELQLIQALDGAVVSDMPILRIIHGKGTGALKALVAEVLRRDSRVASFKTADPRQGGTGVTEVEFK
jgi:DNA mismatch repair protein MutS2